jgi:hypothetical protein
MTVPAAEERRRRLSSLRRQHNHAIEQFRYSDAAAIQSEIDQIITDPLTYNWRRFPSDRLSTIKSQYDQQKDAYVQDRDQILQTYRTRFAALTARQDEELAALSDECDEAVERELVRPVPDVDHLLMRSRVYAKDHQYEYANEVYREALRRRDESIRERVEACKAAFRDQRRQMAEKHARELEVMDEGISASLERLDQEYGMCLKIIGHRHRINEFRNGVWPPGQYSLGPFHEKPDIQRGLPGRRRRRTASASEGEVKERSHGDSEKSSSFQKDGKERKAESGPREHRPR